MTTHLQIPATAAALVLLSQLASSAAVHYVDVNGSNPTPPFLDWSTAATNIQDAVDSALTGDEVLVTNGVYRYGGRSVGTNILVNRVAVDKSVKLLSINGPEFTVIEGYQLPGTTNGEGAVRCVYLTNGAILSGFTLTKGATRGSTQTEEGNGGGVWCPDLGDALVTNCLIMGNSAYQWGGGGYGGGFHSCLIQSNSAYSGAGVNNAFLTNCYVVGNRAAAYGGGAQFRGLYQCTLAYNTAKTGGGASYSSLYGCLVVSNRAIQTGGGVVNGGNLDGCTIVGNTAFQGGGVAGGNSGYNCIIYYNYASSPIAPNTNSSQTPLRYSCTVPFLDMTGNITNEPGFLSPETGDFRLRFDSPCINAGRNDYARTPLDLDGLPRIVSGTVDMGAYEFQGAGSKISYAWLQGFGWPIDGSADDLDPDGDGMNNWEEWVAGTAPTSPASALQMLSATGQLPNVTVSWQSIPYKLYWLERSSNCADSYSFVTVRTNISGKAGASVTQYTDTTATNGGPFFYRVGVNR